MNCSASNLSELESIIASLIVDAKCACHIINPHKTRILMWKEVKDDQTTYHLRIGIQKFTSQEQIDRNGEVYWRYYTAELKKEEAKEGVNKETQSEKRGVHSELSQLDPITKFQQRQAQAINHGESANQLSVKHRPTIKH